MTINRICMQIMLEAEANLSGPCEYLCVFSKAIMNIAANCDSYLFVYFPRRVELEDRLGLQRKNCITLRDS